MQTAAIILSVTFALGYLASLLRLPPLVGFLASGFVLNAAALEQVPIVDVVADLGVTLLLFGIGLNLDVRSLLGKEVWLTASLHMVVNIAAAMGLLGVLSLTGIGLMAGTSAGTWAILGLALAFSSTVFVVKVLEERGHNDVFYGRLSIGILVIQDLVAVVFLTASSGALPSPWAFSLVLLWPVTRLFRQVWAHLGHGEMQSLFGIVMALVPGYLLFDLVGLKGDLGALIIGMLLASHPSSAELSRALFHFKELLLVGFFVSIGLAGGLPTFEDIAVALCLLLLLPFKAVVYALLLWAMRVRHRTGWLTAVALMQFSEFGLIVVAVGAGLGLLEQRWLLVLSVALSLSFVASSAVNTLCRGLIERLAARAPQQNQTRLHPEDRPADITGAEVIILGMGRVGRSAYDRLVDSYHMKVAGVDADGTRVERLTHEGRWVVEGDSSDAEFWNRLGGRQEVRFAVIAMPRHGANLSAVRALRDGGFTGPIAAVARYDDEVDQAVSDGADTAFNVYTGAGLELADQVMLVQRPAQQPLPD